MKEEEKNHSHCLNICTRQDQPSAQLEEAHSLAATISHEWCPQLCHLAAPQLDLSLFESENGSVVSDSLQPHGLCSPWNSLGQNTGVGSLSLLQGIFLTQGIEPRSPTLQVDSLPAEPQGKPKNTGVSSLSLHQRIFQPRN